MQQGSHSLAGPIQVEWRGLGVPSPKCQGKQQSLPPPWGSPKDSVPRADHSYLVSAQTVALRARPPAGHQEERETMQGPQCWGAPPPQLSQEMSENRKNQPEGWRSPLLRCPFLTPLSPFAQPPTKSLDPRPGEGVLSISFLGRLTDKILCRASRSLQAQEKQETAGLLANSPHWAQGKRGHTGVSGGFSAGAFSGLAPPSQGQTTNENNPSRS